MQERAIYFEAAEIPDAEARRRFLDQACGDDHALRQRLENLLKADGRLGAFLQAGSTDAAGLAADDIDAATQGAARAAVTDWGAETEESAAEELEKTPDLSFLLPPVRPGTLGRLAHYDILDVLGQGGFGIVLRARDTKLERDVAIKVLQRHLAATSPPRKRFLREARACAAIHHPNVITLYAVEEQPLPYLVMEYVRGSTLQDLINEAGPLEWNVILPLVLQLALALDMAHARGLIHRDIKPSNILVEPGLQRRMVITDFGLARTVDDISLTRSGFIAGTPMYMSPEQAEGAAVDARADLFSLGSVLYVMVTGRPPFRASSSAAVMRRVILAQPRGVKELIPDAPDWLCALIAKLQAKSPEDRFQSARELADWLEQCQAELQQGPTVRPATLQALQMTPPTNHETVSSNRSLRGSVLAGGLLSIGILLALAALVIHEYTGNPVDQPTALSATDTALQTAPSTPSNGAEPIGGDAPPILKVPFAAQDASRSQQAWADYLELPVEFTNRWGISFRLIPPGTFLMGSTDAEIAAATPVYEGTPIWQAAVQSESPQHAVELTQPFYLATTEVTQRQFEQIMSYDTSQYKASDEDPEGRRPAEKMAWNEATAFAKRISHRDGLISWADVFDAQSPARGYRLPTEAEWEFACRGGTDTPFWSGSDERKITLVENLEGSGVDHPLPVGSRQANPFGLFDMHGNVREYVSDFWSSKYYANADAQTVKDPQGPTDAGLTYRVHRGGDFWWAPAVSRSASRCVEEPDMRPGLAIGIRLALDVTASKRLHENLILPAVTDFRELHAATLPQLRSWIDGLGEDFVPRLINIRSGGSEVRFEAIATPNTEQLAWQVRFVPAGQRWEQFESLRATRACIWWVTIPEWGKEGEPIDGIAIWREATEGDWGAWTWDLADLEPRLLEAGSDGWISSSIDLVVNDPAGRADYCHRLRPGIGHHTLLQRSPSELSRDIQAFRRRGYRPHLIQSHASDTEPLLSAVFRENVDQLAWEFTDRLTQTEYEAELKTRAADQWYPAIVYSYVEAESPLYGVVWRPLAGAKPTPP